jgi:hypothetical protein
VIPDLRESRWESNLARMRRAAAQLSSDELARLGVSPRGRDYFVESIAEVQAIRPVHGVPVRRGILAGRVE